ARLGGTWDGEKVLKAVEVSPEGESNIVAVTATAESAGESARVANVFAASALADRREQLDSQIEAELERLRLQQESLATPSEDIDRRIVRIERLSGRGDPTLSLSQSAVPPTSSSDVPALVVLALALVAGLALGAGACVLLEITRARVRDEGEALALYPLPVLARVPELSRRKRETPHGPQGWYMPPSIREAFRTVVVQLERAPEQRVIMVMSGSTGDGKTTSAVNLSASLAAAGHRVVLMDFDVRKPDVARVLGLEAEEQPLSALLDPSVELGSLVTRVPHLPSLLVLPTSVAGHGDVALVEALGRRLPYLLAEAQQMSRYVVIDTAPLGEVSDALRLTSEVDEIVIVTRLGHTRRANYEVMRDLLEGSDSRPRGLIVIGATQMVSHRYYSYGMAAQRAISESLSEVPDSGWGIRSR
ncbi:MAG: P-loop NTPase, partial [Thermoleophilaceae bacterium]